MSRWIRSSTSLLLRVLIEDRHVEPHHKAGGYRTGLLDVGFPGLQLGYVRSAEHPRSVMSNVVRSSC